MGNVFLRSVLWGMGFGECLFAFGECLFAFGEGLNCIWGVSIFGECNSAYLFLLGCSDSPSASVS